MNLSSGGDGATTVRDAYFRMSVDRRSHLLVKVSKAQPDFLRYVLRTAHINGHRVESAASWLKDVMLRRIESHLNGKDPTTSVEEAVELFFTEARPTVAQAFFSEIAALVTEDRKPTTGDRDLALKTIAAQYSDDPYLELFQTWVTTCCRFADGAAADLKQTSEQKLEMAGPDRDSQESVRSDFGELDATLQTIDASASALRNLKAADLEKTKKDLHRAGELVGNFVSALERLAAEQGVPVPVWQTRDEFVAACRHLSAAAAEKRARETDLRQFQSDLVRLLRNVRIRHRSPQRQASLVEVAQEASEEIGRAGTDVLSSLPCVSGDSLLWMEAIWKLEGASLDESLRNIKKTSPALADLIAEVSWEDLSWLPSIVDPIPPIPTSESVQRPTAPAAEVQPARPSAEAVSQIKANPETVNSDVFPSLPVELNPKAPEPDVESGSDGTKQTALPDTKSGPTVLSLSDPPVEPETALSDLAPSACGVSVTPVVWRLVRENRWGLAGHLANTDDTVAFLPECLFHAAALAPRINYEVSPTSELLSELFGKATALELTLLPEPMQRAARLLIAGATFRPALLAPLTGAHATLGRLHLREEMHLLHLDLLVNGVADFSRLGEALQPDMLQGTRDHDQWERQLAEVKAEIYEWLKRASHSQFTFKPAFRVWFGWLGASGALRKLLEQTANGGVADFEALQRAWHPWVENPNGQIQGAMKSLGQTKPMDGVHRDKLITKINEAVQLAQRVLALFKQAPENRSDFRHSQYERLLATCREQIPLARQELAEMQSHGGDEALVCSAQFCRDAIDDIDHLLHGKLPLPGAAEPEPRWLLDGELLRDLNIQIGKTGFPYIDPERAQDRLMRLAETPPNWIETWNEHFAAENHALTGALQETFRWFPDLQPKIGELERRREHALDDCRRKIITFADKVTRLLEDFVSLGLCSEQQYADLSSELESVRRDSDTAVQFLSLKERLNALEKRLGQQRENAVSSLKERLALSKEVAPEAAKRINALLTIGDVTTANEYLDLALEGRPLPDEARELSLFDAFFGDGGWLGKSEPNLREVSVNEITTAARSGSESLGLDFQWLSPEQRERAASDMHLWFNLERQRHTDIRQVSELALALGLRPTRVEAFPMRRGANVIQPFLIHAELMTERVQALVPRFGSEAGGRYHIHLLWGEVGPDEIVANCRAEPGDTAAHILVCMWPLNTRERRELADEARTRIFKAIVVDRALFLFVCAQPGARLANFLRCALPFSRVEPYSIASGAVPPEMFFGRAREFDSLVNPHGSCFVFGGRQLGKTALLRAVERSFHNPANGRAAIYLDLKTELTTRGRPMDDLWGLLLARLKDKGVLMDEKVGASAGGEAFVKHVNNWLNGNATRRLLVLLDEADQFLDEDSKETERHEPFPRCQRLKGLMDESQRRFKVIFAGLHNVQRTTRISNHPLAHLGEAICIGPMIEESEARSARQLVEQPLAQVGFNFELPDSISHILALTNYYPSLIQLFCYHLLRDLRDNYVARFPNRNATPPCHITAQHVQAVYNGRVRKEIYDKVGLTLDLDPRYKLIAYLLAFYHLNQTGGGGVEATEIRSEAAGYWPSGFADIRTDDEFRALLEEMIGLGILRQVGTTSRFAMRNSNVLRLFGTDEEISRRLDAAATWEPPQKYEADKFRRVVEDKPQLILSPLSAQQESDIRASENRVIIIYGLPVAGLLQLQTALGSLFREDHILLAESVRDSAGLIERVRNIERRPDTQTSLIIPPQKAWDETWVVAASQQVSQFVSKSAFLSVVFVADALRTRIVSDGLYGAREGGIRGITLGPLHDAAVRWWLNESGISDSDRSLRSMIYSATGNWPALVWQLATCSRDDLIESCEKMKSRFANQSELSHLRGLFALGEESDSTVLGVAANFGNFTVEDVCEFLEGRDEARRKRIIDRLNWAERLGLVVQIGNGAFAFDPIARQLVLAPSS